MHKTIGSYDCETLNSLLNNLAHRYESLGGNSTRPELLPEENQSLIVQLRRKLEILFEVLFMNPEYEGSCSMNHYSPRGTQVKTLPSYKPAPIFTDPEEAEKARRMLQPDNAYTVRSIIVDDPFAYVELEEFPGLRFDSMQFEPTSRPERSAEELFQAYGPELDGDCGMVDRLMASREDPPEPTFEESLQNMKSAMTRSPHINHGLLEWAACYLMEPRKPEPRYPVGTRFNDGFRTLVITGAQKVTGRNYFTGEDMDTWNYTCHFEEHNGDALETTELEYKEHLLRVVELADVDLDVSGLSNQELEIRELTKMNGGWL